MIQYISFLWLPIADLVRHLSYGVFLLLNVIALRQEVKQLKIKRNEHPSSLMDQIIALRAEVEEGALVEVALHR